MSYSNTDNHGVSETLSGYVIESGNITTTPQREQVADQQNAVQKEKGSTMSYSNTDNYGVSETLSGYVIESCNITTTPQREQVADQQNAVQKEIRYDTRYDLRLTMRGASEPANTTITVGGKTFLVDSVEKAGTYNGLQRWNVTGHCYANCTSETTLS